MTMTSNRKSYKEMLKYPDLRSRFEYLKLDGVVGDSTFGHNRILNQEFYRSEKWRQTRDKVIIRDGACDLGVEGHDIYGMVVVHHINPITEQDIIDDTDALYDLDNLVCCRYDTHQAIHFGDSSLLPQEPVVRRPNDTIPWKTSKWK